MISIIAAVKNMGYKLSFLLKQTKIIGKIELIFHCSIRGENSSGWYQYGKVIDESRCL